MRTLYEIVEDVKDNKKPDYEEIRYALLVYTYLFNKEHRHYRDALLKINSTPAHITTSEHIRELKAQNSFDMYKTALNTPPKEYLGWNNDPENPDYQKFREIGNKIIDNVLGSK